MRDKTRTIEEAAKRVRDASKQIARCLFGGPLITHAIIVSDESIDCATGHCECELRVTTTNVMEENAELRKLARDVYVLHWSGLDCTECPWIGECDTDGGCPWLGIMADHMRDIGIEVPR